MENKDVRQKYLALLETLRQNKKDASDTPLNVEDILKESDSLVLHVTEPSDACLDAKVIDLASELEIERTLKHSTRNKPNSMLLCQKLSSTEQPLALLSSLFKACYRGVSGLSILSGCEELKAKERTKRQRTCAEEETQEHVPEKELKSQDADVPRKIHTIYRCLKKAEPVNIYKFCVDPNSFAQSVENLFYVSFLVKERKIVYDSKTELLSVCEGERGSSHVAVVLNHALWKQSIKKYSISAAMIYIKQ